MALVAAPPKLLKYLVPIQKLASLSLRKAFVDLSPYPDQCLVALLEGLKRRGQHLVGGLVLSAVDLFGDQFFLIGQESDVHGREPLDTRILAHGNWEPAGKGS